MAKIETYISSLVNGNGKSELHFRISINRSNRFRIESGIFVYAERFKDGEIKPQRAEDGEGRRRKMLNADDKLSDLKKIIINSCENNSDISKAEMKVIIDQFHNPGKYLKKETSNPLIIRFKEYVEQSYKDGIFGEGRKKHYDVLHKELNRFLIINNLTGIKSSDFTNDKIALFREFLFNEHKLTNTYKDLYIGMTKLNIPTKQRSQNTVATKLKKLQAFFNDLESNDEIPVSPFRKLGKQRKTIMMKEQYDEPFFLTKDEFLILQNTTVSESLKETKDAFLLQCSLGCRISDFQSLSFDNMSIEDNIPYIHYLPKKTMNEGDTRKEIRTPLLLFALKIINQYEFKFPILRYVSGERGYNDKIKELLKHCKINRLVAVFNEIEGKNEYKPIYEVASSKLARKTHVDIMNKVQINQYASGLHKAGSTAVNRYTSMSIKDRFQLMCVAFDSEEYSVDLNFNIQEKE